MQQCARNTAWWVSSAFWEVSLRTVPRNRHFFFWAPCVTDWKKQSFKRLEIYFHISIKEANVLRRDYKEVRMLIWTFWVNNITMLLNLAFMLWYITILLFTKVEVASGVIYLAAKPTNKTFKGICFALLGKFCLKELWILFVFKTIL